MYPTSKETQKTNNKLCIHKWRICLYGNYVVYSSYPILNLWLAHFGCAYKLIYMLAHFVQHKSLKSISIYLKEKSTKNEVRSQRLRNPYFLNCVCVFCIPHGWRHKRLSINYVYKWRWRCLCGNSYGYLFLDDLKLMVGSSL